MLTRLQLLLHVLTLQTLLQGNINGVATDLTTEDAAITSETNARVAIAAVDQNKTMQLIIWK